MNWNGSLYVFGEEWTIVNREATEEASREDEMQEEVRVHQDSKQVQCEG